MIKNKMTKNISVLLLMLSLLFCFFIAWFVKYNRLNKAVYDLRVNMLSEPYGVSRENISFSWKIGKVEKELKQEYSRIVFARTKEELQEEKYLFDTGWCKNRSNTYVVIDNLENYLEDNNLYFWSVAVRTESGKEYGFSKPQIFTTAVGSEWKSKKGIWGGTNSDFVFFRNEFEIAYDKIEKVILNVTASSPENTRQYVYQLYLNGTEIGAGPAREKDGGIIYNTYDITKSLKNGKNAVGAVCYSDSEKAFLCQCTLFYKDGTKEILFNTGEEKTKWRVLDGDLIYRNGINSIGTSYYSASAENIDGRIFPFGWNEINFDEKDWGEPVYNNIFDNKELVTYTSENMREYTVSPVKIVRNGDHYFIDMGKEIVGGLALKVSDIGEDTEITLHYGEELNSDGTVMYQMRTGNVYEEKWILPAKENRKLENIGMKTYRYVDIYNCPIELTKDNVEGIELRQYFDEEKSYFDSDDDLLNRIYEMAKYTIKETNQNLYVDSQSWERAPYEGDAYINMLTSYSFSDNYTLARFSNEYLYYNRTWPQEYAYLSIICAYEDYMYTGNVESLEENYECLLAKLPQYEIDPKYNLYALNINENGVDTPLVDWPETQRDHYAYEEAEYNTVVNAVAYGAYVDMIKIAYILQKDEDAKRLEKIAENLKDGMIDYLYNAEEGAFRDGLDETGSQIEHYSQHATAYALRFGIYTDKHMADSMIDFLKSTGEMKMSVYGAQFLLDGLYQNDAGDFANQLMLADSRLSWKTMIDEAGATISAEAWSVEEKDNMTFSHPWGAAPGNLIVRGLFGIRPTMPGFETFEVKIHPGSVKEAEIKIPTVKGEIEVSYCLNEEDKLEFISVVVPPNTEADVYVPLETCTILSGKKKVKNIVNGYNYGKVHLKSGEYKLRLKYNDSWFEQSFSLH